MRSVLLNVLLNAVLAVAFVLLSNRALANGLEETLISLAVMYGSAVIVANAAFTALVSGRRQA